MFEEAEAKVRSSPTSLKVTGWWLFWTAAAFLMMLGFMFWLLFQWGGFGGTATADGAKLAAGVLAVVGTVLTASITFVGLLLRLAQQERAIQIQAEAGARHAEAEARTIQIQTDAEVRHAEAEARLHMEAAIQAVSFMGDTTSDGMPVSNAQRAGAIYALANLGQMPLAIVLLDQVWAEGKIDPAFGGLIAHDVLEGDDGRLHLRVSEMLLANAHTMWTTGGQLLWLQLGLRGIFATEPVAQGLLAQAMLKTLTNKPIARWGGDATTTVVGTFYDMLTEPNIHPDIKLHMASALDVVLDRSPLWMNDSTLRRVSGELVSVEQMKLLTAEVRNSTATGHRQLDDAVQALENYLAEAE